MRISYLNRFLFMPRQFSFKLNLKLRIFLLLLLLLVLWQCTCTKDLCFALNLLLYFFFFKIVRTSIIKKKQYAKIFHTLFRWFFSHTFLFFIREDLFQTKVHFFIYCEWKNKKRKILKKIATQFFPLVSLHLLTCYWF